MLKNSDSSNNISRIIDANINRTKEGLRVCEEIARFILESRSLTSKFKTIRHKIDIISRPLNALTDIIRERESLKDIGKEIYINELQRRIDQSTLYAVCYIDLDKFKVYNDKYGFEHGDEVIKESARIFIKVIGQLGNPDDFIGHIGGDDFVIITSPDKVDVICEKIISEFDKTSPTFYNEEDRKIGFIMAKDRKGMEIKVPLLSISIGVVSNEKRKISHLAEIGEIGAELKQQAKNVERSVYIKDQRKDV